MIHNSCIFISLSIVAQLIMFTGCISSKSQLNKQMTASEKEWQRAFDELVEQTPKCEHTLVEGEKSYALFSGSCFECRKQLGVTETKVNKFWGTRKTTTAKTYTCSSDCNYNVCQSCAEKR
jgi:hypothetical protein